MKKGIKKFSLGFLAGLILLGLIGCSNENDMLNDTGEMQAIENGNDNEPINGLGSFTFFEGRSYSDDRDTGVNVISLEEAAEIGAYYIYEVLGESLDGMYMELVYNYNFHISHRTWVGHINHSRIEGITGQMSAPIFFLIDAETGERLSLNYSQLEDLHGISGEMMESMPIEDLLEIFPDPDEDEIAEMMEVAREMANRHFQTSEVAVVEYGLRQEDGGPNITWERPYQISALTVIDTEGRLIEVYIQRETHLLWQIITPFQ